MTSAKRPKASLIVKNKGDFILGTDDPFDGFDARSQSEIGNESPVGFRPPRMLWANVGGNGKSPVPPAGYVYFSTSSMVVSPSKMQRRPSWRRVTMPSSIAFCRITTLGARSLINSRIGSLTCSNS